jgi:hypothetical protein
MEPPSGRPIKKDLRSSGELAMRALQLSANGIDEMPSTKVVCRTGPLPAQYAR